MIDALISKIENVSLHKTYSKNKPVVSISHLQHTNCFPSADVNLMHDSGVMTSQ